MVESEEVIYVILMIVGISFLIISIIFFVQVVFGYEWNSTLPLEEELEPVDPRIFACDIIYGEWHDNACWYPTERV